MYTFTVVHRFVTGGTLHLQVLLYGFIDQDLHLIKYISKRAHPFRLDVPFWDIFHPSNDYRDMFPNKRVSERTGLQVQ